MSLQVTNTQAGDTSDGKNWGIEGTNIIIVLVGVAISFSCFFVLTKNKAHSASYIACVGSMPTVLSIAYVFGLRQGKPKRYDIDLLETFAHGTGWQPDFKSQRKNPIYECA